MSGRIPELNLKTGCADDFSFEFHKQTIFLSDLTITCDSTFNLDDFNLSFQEMQLILERCPNAYNHGNCSTASSRGPVLLLQSNRFSCSLPTRVTSEAGVASLRSLILMGNMLGNGTKALPDWVHDTENQPFLYLDGLFLAIYLSFLDPEIPEAPLKPFLDFLGSTAVAIKVCLQFEGSESVDHVGVPGRYLRRSSVFAGQLLHLSSWRI